MGVRRCRHGARRLRGAPGVRRGFRVDDYSRGTCLHGQQCACGTGFVSHSSWDSRQAVAIKAWLIEPEPGLAEEIGGTVP